MTRSSHWGGFPCERDERVCHRRARIERAAVSVRFRVPYVCNLLGEIAPCPKFCLVIGDATEVLDTMYPFFRLPEDGFEVVVAGPEKEAVSHGSARSPARLDVGHHARDGRLSFAGRHRLPRREAR